MGDNRKWTTFDMGDNRKWTIEVKMPSGGCVVEFHCHSLSVSAAGVLSCLLANGRTLHIASPFVAMEETNAESVAAIVRN